MIHVCFCFHDRTGNYAKFAGTAMLSIFENTKSSVTVHILHDDTLTADNLDKFSYIAGRYGQTVRFHNVEKLCPDKIKEYISYVPSIKNSRVSVGAFYRLMLSKVLPSNINKIIYFDADVIVNLDIKELWQIELGDKPLGAVPESVASSEMFKSSRGYAIEKYLIKSGLVKFEDYFNSGVMALNLDYLRQNDELLTSGVKFRGENKQCSAFDQDILNYLFANDYLKLPGQFDQFIRSERRKEDMKSKIRQVIYHYTKNTLQLNSDDIFNQLWLSYFMLTPWFNTDAIGKLYASFQQARNNFKSYISNASAFMSNRARVFFVEPQKLSAVKEAFSIRDDEEVIIAENQESLKNLAKSMLESRGKKIFYIMTEKVLGKKFPFKQLARINFVEGRDFIKGWEILSDAKGTPFDSFPFIQAM
ncbi:MAG: glycosyltransferase family 8 protein [Selenomonadaceae bacterium]|nr:glycosyltransferase family 8 protein [Selenomonadaceae bacterium]